MGSIYKRGRIYWYKYYIDGKYYRVSLQTDIKEEAESFAEQYCHLEREKPSLPKKGIVYFIGNIQAGYVKIGFSKVCAKTRLKALQTGCPFKLKVLHIIKNVSKEKEKDIHSLFNDLHYRGEWFQFTPNFVKFLSKNLTYNMNIMEV